MVRFADAKSSICCGVISSFVNMLGCFCRRLTQFGTWLSTDRIGTCILFISPQRRAVQFLTIIACYCVFGGKVQCAGLDFKVEAEVQITPYDANGEPQATRTVPVTVWVKDQQWSIRAYETIDIYQEYGCDGVDTIGVARFPPEADKPSNDPAVIVKGLYPLGAHTMIVKFPWLVFASAHYLDSLTNNVMPVPWAIARQEPYAQIYKFVAERSKSAPFLLENVEFRASTQLAKHVAESDLMDLENLNVEVRKNRLEMLSCYQEGFVGGRYQVLSKSDFGGMALPAIAELKTFTPDWKNSNGGLFEVYKLTVKKVSRSDLESYLPQLSGRVSVVDYRFRDHKLKVDFIAYPITNGLWTTRSEPRLMKTFEAKRKTETK